MRRDAIELDRFYRTARGALAQRMIERRLSAVWPNLKDLDVLGMGYATPYLRDMQGAARRCIDLMPSTQGAIAPTHPSNIVMGDETRMPFPDAMFDRVGRSHMLEEAEHLPGVWRETFRDASGSPIMIASTIGFTMKRKYSGMPEKGSRVPTSYATTCM